MNQSLPTPNKAWLDNRRKQLNFMTTSFQYPPVLAY